jgi:uncharacterized protein
MKGPIMRTSSICATAAALAACVVACSDGSGLIPGAAGSATSSSSGSPSTPGAGTTALPTAGNAATGGAASTTGGTGAGTGPVAGSSTGGSSTGGSTTTGGAAAGGSAGGTTTDPYSGPFKILVLHTTLDFPHDSIPICALMVGVEGAFSFQQGKLTGADLRKEVEVTENRGAQPPSLGKTPDAMMPVGTKPGSQWTADLATDDLAQFTEANLKQYSLIFSCNPTGTVFSANSKVADKPAAMAAFQKFVEGGGAWAGVHSATDFEKSNGFPWFTNTLVGGYFDHHDNDGTSGTVQMQSMFTNHPVLKGLKATWSAQDEWYYMNRDVSAQPGFQILGRLASDNRPVIWIKELGTNGRAFYTIRGHNKSVYEEPDFRKLVLNGILWATHRLEQ